jgi:hypothetical protein
MTTRARDRSSQRAEAPAVAAPTSVPGTTVPESKPTGMQKEEGMLPNPYRH